MQLTVCVSSHQCSLPLFLACSASWRCLVAAAASAAALSFWNSAATAWKQRSKVTIVIHTLRAAKLADEQRVAMWPQQTYTCWTFVTLVWHVTALFSISMIQQCVEKSLFMSKHPFSGHFKDWGNMVKQMLWVFAEGVCVGEEKGEQGGVFSWNMCRNPAGMNVLPPSADLTGQKTMTEKIRF